jgi:predicted O-methyltransferase YrrM
MIRNVLANALNPKMRPEMIRKLFIRPRYGFKEHLQALEWAAKRVQHIEEWAHQREPLLWNESERFANELRMTSSGILQLLASRGVDLGGGGSIELLYFMVRLRQPNLVLETGVAAGWSSWAILAALERNGSGRLKSSDFPYFRIQDPERYIGILVPDDLKHRWDFAVEGDRKNLSTLLTDSDRVDLVHYDSDKSRPGRDWFVKAVEPYLSPGAVLIWDDIEDNLAFRDHSQLMPETYVLKTLDGIVGLAFTA